MTHDNKPLGDSDSFTRRKVLKATGVSGSALSFSLLSGCTSSTIGSSTDTPSQNAEEVVPGERDFSGTTITWYGHTSPTIESVKSAASKWESRTGGTVNFEIFSPPDLFQKFQNLFNSGSKEIDIASYAYQWGTLLTAGGHLTDLNPYIERLHDGWDRDDWVDHVWKMAGQFPSVTESGHYGIPSKLDMYLAFWNKNHFEEAGYDIDRAPQDWDELLQYSETLHSEEVSGFTQSWGMPFSPPAQWLLNLKTMGGEMMDANGYPVFWLEGNRDIGLETLKYWADLVEYSPRGYASMAFNEAQAVFAQEKASILYQYTSFVPPLIDPEKSKVHDNLGIGHTACGDVHCGTNEGEWGAGVPVYSENKEAAFDFIAFAFNPENSLAGGKQGMASGRASVLTNDEVNERGPWNQVVHDQLTEREGGAFPQPRVIGYITAKPDIADLVHKVVTHQLTSDDEIVSEMKKTARKVFDIAERQGNTPAETAEKP